MTAWLLGLLLLQAGPGTTGFATGVVRSADGSPAAGVRVYAVRAGDPSAVSTDAAVFESLAQTDASGRYRLEIPVGRYFIAVGSVTSPTYYPDTQSVASAKTISIAAGATVESVDFSRYIVATSPTSGPTGIRLRSPTGPTTILSGVIRASNGSAVEGITVVAVPVQVTTLVTAGTTGYQFRQVITDRPNTQQSVGSAITDSHGRYQIDSLLRGFYVIAAGFSHSPVFYPGTNELQTATVVEAVGVTQIIDLDFALPRSSGTFSIRGSVLASAGRSLDGVIVHLEPVNSDLVSQATVLLPTRIYRAFIAGGDGRFELSNILPGKYVLQVRIPGQSPLSKTLEVTDRSLELDFLNQIER